MFRKPHSRNDFLALRAGAVLITARAQRQVARLFVAEERCNDQPILRRGTEMVLKRPTNVGGTEDPV